MQPSMSGDFDPPMTRRELRASLAAFDLRWPFPRDCWNHGRIEIRPNRDSTAGHGAERPAPRYDIHEPSAFMARGQR